MRNTRVPLAGAVTTSSRRPSAALCLNGATGVVGRALPEPPDHKTIDQSLAGNTFLAQYF